MFWIWIHKHETIKYFQFGRWNTDASELNMTSTGQELSTSDTFLRGNRVLFCSRFFILTQSFQMEGNRDNKIYQYFSQGLWSMAEIKTESNFQWKLKCRTVLLLRKFSNKIHFSFCVTIRKKDIDNTTRLFSILSLNVCNVIVYTEIENINSLSQEVYFNMYNVVCYIYAYSEKKGIYKFCLKK